MKGAGLALAHHDDRPNSGHVRSPVLVVNDHHDRLTQRRTYIVCRLVGFLPNGSNGRNTARVLTETVGIGSDELFFVYCRLDLGVNTSTCILKIGTRHNYLIMQPMMVKPRPTTPVLIMLWARRAYQAPARLAHCQHHRHSAQRNNSGQSTTAALRKMIPVWGEIPGIAKEKSVC